MKENVNFGLSIESNRDIYNLYTGQYADNPRCPLIKKIADVAQRGAIVWRKGQGDCKNHLGLLCVLGDKRRCGISTILNVGIDITE